MRIHYNYLAHLIHPLPPVEQAAERLTRVGLEVEGIEDTNTIQSARVAEITTDLNFSVARIIWNL